MSKKIGMFVCVFVLMLAFMTGLASAAESNATKQGAEKGYECLESLIDDKTTSSISLQEAIFSTLAIGGEKVLKDKIAEEKSSSTECWPKEKCKVKETSQVGLAYKRISKGTDDIEKWLYTKNGTSNELIWYLEVDITNHEAAECTLRYDGNEKKINILDDMTLTGNPGNCFTISNNGYFLQFRDSCFQKDIEISCEKDFITAALYTKKIGDTLYVLPETHSSAALGTTTEKVNVQCFKIDGKCDYEGSLWATLFLHKLGEEVDSFVPYLVALADDNIEFFPESFLYALTGSDDQYSNMIQKQKLSKTWKMVGTPYNEFYDTSLAMLALSDSEKEATKLHLVSIQSASGCWNNNNIRDTAFILYSGWSKSVAGEGSGGGGTPLCTTLASQSCEIYNECIDAGGRSLPNFECSGFNICCSLKVPEQSCQEQGGSLCSDTQRCEGSSLDSSEDAVCCLGTCEAIEQIEETCVSEGYSCESSCLEDSEKEVSGLTCNSGNICCKAVEKKSYGWLIVLLVILIILAVLAIVFKDKLRFYWYKYKGQVSSKPVVKPGVPPSDYSAVPRTMPQRPAINNVTQRPIMQPRPRAPPQQKSKEFEDTLKKLREMSK